MQDSINNKKYGALLLETFPRRIETEEENERFLQIVEKLIDKGEGNLSPEESMLLDLLATLIEEFEEKAYPMGEISTPLSTLKFLMEQNDLKQKDLVSIFGSQGIASEVLNGKRGISKAHAKALAERFNVSVELFVTDEVRKFVMLFETSEDARKAVEIIEKCAKGDLKTNNPKIIKKHNGYSLEVEFNKTKTRTFVKSSIFGWVKKHSDIKVLDKKILY